MRCGTGVTANQLQGHHTKATEPNRTSNNIFVGTSLRPPPCSNDLPFSHDATTGKRVWGQTLSMFIVSVSCLVGARMIHTT